MNELMTSAEIMETTESESRLSLETVQGMKTLEVEVAGNFSETLDAINEDLGLDMASREGDFHITVISPPESKILKNLSEEQLDELYLINEKIKNGEGISVDGIGIIEGDKRDDLREVDTAKKACFVAVSIPEMDTFRENAGLPKKDFHLTLGFETGDIHMKIVGTKENGKPILGPIEKKADPGLEKYNEILGEVSFAGLNGQEQ